MSDDRCPGSGTPSNGGIVGTCETCQTPFYISSTIPEPTIPEHAVGIEPPATRHSKTLFKVEKAERYLFDPDWMTANEVRAHRRGIDDGKAIARARIVAEVRKMSVPPPLDDAELGWENALDAILDVIEGDTDA